MSEERLRILQMLKNGKITVDEANSLLEALPGDTVGHRLRRENLSNKFLRVRVSERGKQKVNLNLPLELARVALRFIPRKESFSLDDIDLDGLLEAIKDGAEGKLVEAENDEGMRVEVFVE